MSRESVPPSGGVGGKETMRPHETSATAFGLRPLAYGRRGMVATANPLASLAGVRMLAQGGNAVDALVAAAAALGVVEPYMSGLAGCGTLILTRRGCSRSWGVPPRARRGSGLQAGRPTRATWRLRSRATWQGGRGCSTTSGP